jgi:hypothetical protein
MASQVAKRAEAAFTELLRKASDSTWLVRYAAFRELGPVAPAQARTRMTLWLKQY